ncbi:MAG TPA: N-acetyl-gamma-glutamyl-phosphate reductase [Ktedonobacterales bacterium]
MASSSFRVSVAVVNGTGYGGVELLRLLRRHPVFEVVEVTARSEAGKRVAEVFPQLAGSDLVFGERVERADLVFVALPDDAAIEHVPELLSADHRVVDLSAAFRLRDWALYPRWYGYEHPAPALLESAVYGLAEWARASLPDARLVAVPGCYPTASLLPLLPLLAGHLIEPDVIVDAKSGVSGAGRTLRLSSHFSEANEDVTAYGLNGHRHMPEIRQQLEQAAGGTVRLTFTPHLIPMTRGILATCYATPRPGVTLGDVRAALVGAYADAPCVRVVEQAPHTKWALGANLCYIAPAWDVESGRLILVSAIDNLVKGAAGQAIQCANLMYGLDEAAGLPGEGVYP